MDCKANLMFSSYTILAVVDQLQCGPKAVSLHYQVQQVSMLDRLLAEEEDEGLFQLFQNVLFAIGYQGVMEKLRTC